MRVVFVGASPLAIHAATELLERGHEVVLIDEDAGRIEALSDQLDCGLIVGDGARPAVLEELAPEQTDHLFCVSDRDESNILAALVGRQLGFRRVVPKIQDAALEPLCASLGLDEVIVPDREIGRRLVDAVENRSTPELATIVHAGVRFLSFEVAEGVSCLADLDLPDSARAIALTRAEASSLVNAESRLESGDVLVLIVEEGALEDLRERFCREQASDGDEGAR